MDAPANDPGTTTLLRLQKMDNETWNRIVTSYFDSIYRWCLEAGLDTHNAADVSQEVFFSALGSIHQYRRLDDATFGGWLRRICQRRIVDFRRKKAEVASGGTDAMKKFSQLEAVRRNLTEDSIEMDLTDERLLSAIAKAQTEFEVDTWRAFWMTMVDGRTTTDTALELGLTKNAVYLAKSRIGKRLRAMLNPQKPESPS